MKRGRCPDCYKAWERERNRSPEHRIWNSPEWKRARKAALARDGYACTECGATADLTVHHIVPLAAGGEWGALYNMRTLCRTCHGSVSGQTVRMR
jgi:5-methylcytosine-specific restriction endonuclease McrA